MTKTHTHTHTHSPRSPVCTMSISKATELWVICLLPGWEEVMKTLRLSPKPLGGLRSWKQKDKQKLPRWRLPALYVPSVYHVPFCRTLAARLLSDQNGLKALSWPLSWTKTLATSRGRMTQRPRTEIKGTGRSFPTAKSAGVWLSPAS